MRGNFWSLRQYVARVATAQLSQVEDRWCGRRTGWPVFSGIVELGQAARLPVGVPATGNRHYQG